MTAAPPPPPPPEPPAGWPQQPVPGDWSAPGYGDWGTQRRNGLGLAALIVGLVALPAILFAFPGLILGAVALGLGIAGRGRVKRREADNGGVTTAGIALGVVAIVGSIAWLATIAYVSHRDQKAYDKCVLTEARDVCIRRYDPGNP